MPYIPSRSLRLRFDERVSKFSFVMTFCGSPPLYNAPGAGARSAVFAPQPAMSIDDAANAAATRAILLTFLMIIPLSYELS